MIQALGKGIYWMILVTIFGLVQLWLNIAITYYSVPQSISLYSMTKDGVLLFFILAVTMGITIDYHLDEGKFQVGKLWKSAAFVFLPLLITIFVIGAYMITVFKPEGDRAGLINLLNICAFCLTLIYASIGKAYLFYKEP